MGDNIEKQGVRAYNMRVIQAIWKRQKHDFGAMEVTNNKYNINSFYGTFEKSRQTLREMVNCEYNYSEKSVSKWAHKIEGKTGIPYKFLTGEEKIYFSKDYEDKVYPQYQKYIECCEEINSQLVRAKEHPCHYSMARIKKIVEKNGNEKQKEKFKDMISRAESAIDFMKQFEDKLNEEIDRMLKTNGYSEFDDVGTYKLFHFIKYGKPYDAASVVTIDNIIEIFKKTRTFELKNLGQQGLKEYITELQKQLKLAEAVYVVAVDCGDFKET